MASASNPKSAFLDVGDIGVIDIFAREGEGILPFQVLRATKRPFEFKDLGVSISPQTNSGVYRFKGTWAGITVDDLFEHDDPDHLIHGVLEVYPSMKVYLSWISGYLQADYHDVLPGVVDQPYGFTWSPVEFISIPKVHLDFYFHNPYGTETINPYIRYNNAVYKIKYLVDAETIDLILRKRLYPKPRWFTVYGPKPFPYNFRANMKLTRPIPVDATKPEIQSIINEWRALGLWVR